MSRRGRALLLVTLLGWLAVVGWLAATRPGHAIDDFFITFRYAKNLAQGHGFVFNPGERVFGTTAPGMGLLLAFIHLVTGWPLPPLATVTTALSLAAVAGALLTEAQREGRTGEALVAGTLLVTCSFFWLFAGGEAPVALALLVTAGLIAGRRPAVAGLLVGLAVWCRPDLALGALALGVLLWLERRRPPWAYGVTGVAVILIGLAAAWLWFGTLLPNTLEAKRLQALWRPDVWPAGAGFVSRAVLQIGQFYAGEAAIYLVVAGLAGHAVLLRRRGRATRLLALYSLGIAVAYPLLGVAFYSWYVIPVLAGLIYGAVYGVGAVARRTSSFFAGSPVGRLAATAVAALLAAPLAVGLVPRIEGVLRPKVQAPRYQIYRAVGLWLRQNTRPDEVTAHVEVGTMGYFSERPVRDLLGLVTPGSLPFIARGDLVGAFLVEPAPAYVVHTARLDGLLGRIRGQPWFADSYREIVRFRHRRTGEVLTLYRRRPGAHLPPAG